MPIRETSEHDAQRVDRRAALGIWASGLMGLTSACTDRGLAEINTPEGKVLQLEKDDFLVLVSDFAPSYRPGERITLKVLINNQSSSRSSRPTWRASTSSRWTQPPQSARY
jgi:hypothetical protein